MGSRSRSRERDRHRSRSPVPRSKPHKSHKSHKHERNRSTSPEPRSKPHRDERISKSHRDEKRSKTHHIKKEPDDDRKKAKSLSKSKWEPEVRVKSEPNENEKKSFGNSQEIDKKGFGNPPTVKEETTNDPEKPSMALSGKLMEDTNMFNGVVINYSEPEEARKPKRRWRFYVFKGEETLPVMHMHRQSAYLIGKDRKIADIPVDHPSCSRQHAVLQYRLVNNKVRPYVIDLNSSNGTYLNNQKIDPQRYVELQEKDVVKFGYSSREYVLLHDNSAGQDD